LPQPSKQVASESRPKTNPELQLADEIARYSSDPLSFVRFAYPWLEFGALQDFPGPRSWQKDVLQQISLHLHSGDRFQALRIAVASGHGVGKSALIGMIADWAMSTCADCRVMITANTEDQLATKTWPEVQKWFGLSINKHWWDITATRITARQKGHEALWRLDRETWSENNTEAFQGLHNLGRRIVVIYDEASSIPDKIWEVTEGALTDENTEIIWLVFGNPTQNTGRFRECFGRYKHRWVTRHIDSRTVPGTNRQQIDKWIEDYGEDSDFVRVRVRGEFPRGGSAQFIAGDVVAAARNRQLPTKAYEGHWKIMVCDVARFGEDQTIIGYRQGPLFVVLDKLRGQSTVQTANRLMMRIKEHDPRTVVIDGDGIGGGVVDYVREHFSTWFQQNPARKLTEFHGGIQPLDSFMYFNLRANMWGAMRDWLATGSIPDDPELAADLTAPEYYFSAKNQIQLEKKEDMKKRGLASPDLGDTLAMSFCATTAGKTQEERDRDKLAAAAPGQDRALLQYKLTMERDAQRERAEQRRPDHW
jgi:hypothetical protein